MQVRSLGWEDHLRRKWEPTPVFLPGKSHGQRSLAGYSPWGHRVGHDYTHTRDGIVKIMASESSFSPSLHSKQLLLVNHWTFWFLKGILFSLAYFGIFEFSQRCVCQGNCKTQQQQISVYILVFFLMVKFSLFTKITIAILGLKYNIDSQSDSVVIYVQKGTH